MGTVATQNAVLQLRCSSDSVVLPCAVWAHSCVICVVVCSKLHTAFISVGCIVYHYSTSLLTQLNANLHAANMTQCSALWSTWHKYCALDIKQLHCKTAANMCVHASYLHAQALQRDLVRLNIGASIVIQHAVSLSMYKLHGIDDR
jgi:hypothetical protein